MPDLPVSPPDAWSPAHRVARALVAPIQRFLAIEASSGLLLIIAVAVALAWANSPLAHSYDSLWHMQIGLHVGGVALERSVHFWVNEGLMTVFFFVVGLEIRRELYEGELSSARRAALPVVAALGGVLAPMLIFIAFNAGRAGAGGWAIPMATDIAFAVGVLTLLGSRAPHGLRVMLLGLAVIDDIIAIVVIAVFFSGGLSVSGLAITACGLALSVVMRGFGVRTPALYIVPGVIAWIGLAHAGIHPTLAGVMLGLLTPVGPQREAVSPAERLIHVLHPWVAFGIMPVFALANAGVALGGASLAGDGLYLFLGIAAGLAVGKPLGITLAALGASRAGIAARSAELTIGGIALVGTVGGIGFTMSLFISQLALGTGPLLATAKLAVLVGSGTAIVAGLLFGRLRASVPHASPVSSADGDQRDGSRDREVSPQL